MRLALGRHDAILRTAIVEHGGRVVKTTGDGIHAAFGRAEDALVAALDAQRGFVTLRSRDGQSHVLDVLTGEQLPRIC